MYFVYMLYLGDPKRGKNRRIYTGYTKNLFKRLIQHLGADMIRGARTTRGQRLELAYFEKFTNQKQAMHREHELKKKTPYNTKEWKLNVINKFRLHNNNKNHLDELNEYLRKFDSLMKSFKVDFKSITDKIESTTYNDEE